MMKKTILMMLSPILLLLILINFNILNNPPESISNVSRQEAGLTSGFSLPDNTFEIQVDSSKTSNVDESADLVDYALSLIGSPYLYGGNSSTGFDCSGFTTHVFKMNGVNIKRSSALQATEGNEIDMAKAAPGDLIIFTGTNSKVRKPGHVGIVISEPGEPIQFVHSSSARTESGVKISKVQNTGYEARFMFIRRVL